MIAIKYQRFDWYRPTKYKIYYEIVTISIYKFGKFEITLNDIIIYL